MVCYRPIVGYRSKTLTKNGKRGVVFSKNSGFSDLATTISCGQCVGCRLERSRQWAVRLLHENKLHDESCFITLTYSDDFLPSDYSLNVKHFQDFMKRLRWEYSESLGKKIRFFHCGEYGENTQRPHYHAILFGIDFPDKTLLKDGENKLYTSEILTRIWGFGHAVIGSVSFESAAYVARYVVKKFKGPDDKKIAHYRLVDPETGEVHDRRPEYCTMSRRPGIARGFVEKFQSDIYPSDECIVNGFPSRPPRAYDNYLEQIDPDLFKNIKQNRKKIGELAAVVANNTFERLRVRERSRTIKLDAIGRHKQF